MSTTPRQLTLGISLGSDLDFENFITGENDATLEAVREAARSAQFVYLWGDTASGRTHLLHAACRAAAAGGRRIALLPCSQAARWEPHVLDGWEMLDLVALDDIEAIAGSGSWERAVFSLYNELRDAGASLLVTARRPPAALESMLPDLQSRLGAMLVYQVHALDDDGRLTALMRKAKTRGMDLPEETGRYLMTRVSRDMRDLVVLLDRLDHASLAQQRKLTIPFVRAQLESSG